MNPGQEMAATRNEARSRLVALIETLETSWLHARDAGATATRIAELRTKLTSLDAALADGRDARDSAALLEG